MADPLRPLPLQGSLVPDEGVVPPVPDIVPPVPEYLQPGIAQAPLSPGLIGDMGATPELMPLQGALPSAPQPALMGALPEVTTPAPTFTPTLEPVAAQPTPAPTPTPTPATAPNRYAGIQRRAVEQASAEAQAARTAAVGYTAFAERLEEINQRDDRARQEAQANLAKLGKQMEADRDEIRELSRVAAAGPSKGAKAGFLIGGALQAIKTMIGAGPANLELMDEVLARDAEQKATAVVEAQRRAGVTGQARDDEMGRQQSLDYFKALAISDTWSQLEADLQAEAAKTTDVAARHRLETAAADARERAIGAEAQAAQAAYGRELGYRKQLADITLKQQQARKTGAEALRAERRALGVGRKRPKDTPVMQSVETQLQGLGKEDLKRVESRGIRDSSGNFLMTPDNKFVAGNTAEEAKKLRAQWGSLQSVNDSLNRLDALRGKYGMEWDITNSAALQDMKSTMAELELKLKDTYQLGVLSDSDLKMLQKITGGDPTGWFDKRPTWEAMRSRVESGYNRELRAHSSYKGKFRLPKGKVVERRLEDISATIDQPYNPRAGTLIPTETRMAALEEERMAMAREGGTAGGLGLATEIAAEKILGRVNEQHVALLRRMESDRKKARDAGDSAMVQKLTRAITDQKEFAAQAAQWGAKQSRKDVEQAEAERTRAERAEQKHAGYEDIIF